MAHEIFETTGAPVTEHGPLDTDDDMLMVGPEAEPRFGRRHVMEVMSVDVNSACPISSSVSKGSSDVIDRHTGNRVDKEFIRQNRAPVKYTPASTAGD